MTSLAAERAAQARWRPRSRTRGPTVFDRMVEREFLPVADQRAQQDRALATLARLAARRVPYYQALYAELGLGPDEVAGVETLPALPVLTKPALLDAEARLRARALPPGERIFGRFETSGTTGRPTRVVMTVRANAMFTVLVQRSHRWHRLDPMRTIAAIRMPHTLPRQPDGSLLADGVTQRLPHWRYVGRVFHTGPGLGFSRTNPLERQIAWLHEQRPAYLVTYPNVLEEHALAALAQPPAPSLAALMGISAQMSPEMRARIEDAFGLPVHQSYGLNEIGVVATRCEAARYHVHAEHCVVEIVDAEGTPVSPGERGRIVVTGLQNLAMPLLRYDSDDTAVLPAGPCPCGRTLPSFTKVIGRYRRWVGLPEGTRERFGTVLGRLRTLPPEVVRSLRRFRVHQRRDGSFELRVVVAGALPDAFARAVHDAWTGAWGTGEPALRIVEVADIGLGPGGKGQEFTSELAGDVPDEGSEGAAGARARGPAEGDGA